MGVHEDSFPESRCCRPAVSALSALGMNTDVGCNGCPFPFCVKSEARRIKKRAAVVLEQQVIILRDLANLGARKLASELGISVRTLQRRIGVASGCHWCNIDSMSSGVFCRPETCTVAFDGSKVVVALAVHRRANIQELKLVETLVGSLFPDGVLVYGNDSLHSHWAVERVGKSEADTVYSRMEELGKFAPALR